MFARAFGGGTPTRVASVHHQLSVLNGAAEAQVRHAASMKVVKERMRSVKNIQKITKAMKMVAAAKLKSDQRRMEAGVPFSLPVKNLLGRLPAEDKSGPVTFLGVTGDKGLCGGVNSAVAKNIRLGLLDEEAKGNSVKVVIIGGKGVATLKRLYADRFVGSFEEVAKVPFNFTTACVIAERVVAMKPSRLKLVSNDFMTMASYDTTVKNAVTLEGATTMDRQEWSKAMDVYSFEPSIYEVWDDLHEFYYGCMVYGSYLESATTEQSQRMSAMDNASKNASEMLDKLSLIYNRARQAKITTELCEIISGASAV